MSISSEITRITNKRDLSFAEVANKGVTVPAGSTIDDLPGLIAQIEQGSGSGSGGIIYQDLDGYLNLSEEEANVISIVDTLDTAGGTIRTITGAVESGGGSGDWTTDGILDLSEPSGDLVTTLTTIGECALFGRHNVTSLTAPNATNLGGNACNGCTGLKKIVIGGSDASFGSYAIRNCSALKEVHVPGAKPAFGFGGYGLQGCTALELIDYGATNTLAFNNLPACPLHTIIVRKSNGLATLGANALDNSTAFQSGGTGGTVYIPEAYYNHLGDGTNLDYKSATNWSVYESYGTITWAKIEGSEYEL